MAKEKRETKSQEIERTHSGTTFLPPVDIYEEKDKLVVVADMPGVDDKNVNIKFEDGILTIRGHVKEDKPKGLRRIYSEYRIGDYQRQFSVPDEIDIEKIEAKIKDGVLTITLPKAPKAKARQIPIKTE